MATELEIEDARALLSPEALTDPSWSDAKIGERLDSGMSQSQLALTFWRQRAAQTSNLVSVSENGSTRNLEVIHKNAAAQVSYWAAVVDEERRNEENEANDQPRNRIRFHRVTRV